MSRPGGPPSQRGPASQHQPPAYQQYQQPHSQHGYQQPHSQHAHHQPRHQPFTPQEAHTLLLDLAGAAAAATLMLVLTCWLLSLGGAFAPGHVAAPGAAAATPKAAAQH